MSQAATGLALTADERDRLMRLVRARGEQRVLRTLDVSRHTLARCVAGLDVRRGTAALVRARLRLLEPRGQVSEKQTAVAAPVRDGIAHQLTPSQQTTEMQTTYLLTPVLGVEGQQSDTYGSPQSETVISSQTCKVGKLLCWDYAGGVLDNAVVAPAAAALRNAHLRPHLDAFFACAQLEHDKVRDQRGLLRSALGGATREQDGLMRLLENGRLEMTNNRSERALRTIAVGRKAWLFVGSDDHAQRATSRTTMRLSLCSRCSAWSCRMSRAFART